MNPLGTVKVYRRMEDEHSATTIAPATGGRLRLKWGKSRGSGNDDSNRPIETASQDRSNVDSKSRESGSSSSSRPKKVPNLSESSMDTPLVHRSKLASKPESALKHRPILPSWNDSDKVEKTHEGHAANPAGDDYTSSMTDDEMKKNTTRNEFMKQHKRTRSPRKDSFTTEIAEDSTYESSVSSASAFLDSSSDFQDGRSASIRSGESEEDRMIRLAMEMSLRSFRDNEEPRHSGGRKSLAGDKSEAELKRRVNPFYPEDSDMSLPVEQTRLAPASITRNSAAHIYDQLDYARKNLSREEAEAIEKALRDSGEDELCRQESCYSSNFVSPSSQRQISLFSNPGDQIAAAAHLSSDEAAAIEQAIREAEVEEKEKALKEQQESLKMALALQTEEATRYSSSRRWSPQDQFQQSHTNMATSLFVGARHSSSPPRLHSLEIQSRGQQHTEHSNPALPGRPRAPAPPQDFDSERSRNRTQLGVDVDEDISFVSNSAYSQFTRSTMSSRETDRSNASIRHSVRRSMDEEVRAPIAEAINGKLIRNCNGVVKEGKKSRVYHATGATNSGGHDVAVKLFKKVVEFRGTPEQLEVFAQNEHSNLLRAHRARVPVPTPLAQKNNVIFMRFMGDTGWPAPQVGALDLRKGSARWNVIYSQVMVAVRR